MELDVRRSPEGLLWSGSCQAKQGKKRKKRARNKLSDMKELTRFRGCCKVTEAQDSSRLKMLTFKVVFTSSMMLMAILLLPASPTYGQMTVDHPKRFRANRDLKSIANYSSLPSNKDKQTELLKKLSSTKLFEVLMKHAIQSKLPSPILPTVTSRVPPPYSLNIPHITPLRDRKLNQKRTKSTQPAKERRPLLDEAPSLSTVEHLAKRLAQLEENEKRQMRVNKSTSAGSSVDSKKKTDDERVDEPILPSDLQSVEHKGLTLNMLIRDEYDFRVKPMLKSLLDQQRIATASSVSSPMSTMSFGNMSLHNHRQEVPSSSNILTSTTNPLDRDLGDRPLLMRENEEMGFTTPIPGQLMPPSEPDMRDLHVTYEKMEDRLDRFMDAEFDDKRLVSDELAKSRKRVKANGAPKNIRIVPPYQFGLVGAQLERPQNNISIGSQTSASSSAPKPVNGYKQQQQNRYPTTRSSLAGDVRNADATTQSGSLVFSDGAHEAERVKSLRERIHLLDSRLSERKKMDQGPDVDEDNEDEEEEDGDEGSKGEKAVKNKTKIQHNILLDNLFSSTMSPLDKLDLRLRGNSSTAVDSANRPKNRKFTPDPFTIPSGPDWSKPVGGGGRLSTANYATTIATLPTTITTSTTTTTTPPPHTMPPVLHPGNYYIGQSSITNGQSLPSLRVPVGGDSTLLQVTTPRYSFQLHEKPKKNATLYSIPNLSISEVISLRPKARDVDLGAKKAQASQEDIIGPLWSPSKIGHQSDSTTSDSQRKKHAQNTVNLLPKRSDNSSYPMLVSVMGSKGLVVSGSNHSRPSPYSTSDYGSSDTEGPESMLQTTNKPGRVYRGGSFFGDQHMESGHDLAVRNESGALYTRFPQQLEQQPVKSSSSGFPRSNSTNLTDKHNAPRFWPAELSGGADSRRRPTNSTNRLATRPSSGTIEDAELSDYATADEDEGDDTLEENSLNSLPPDQRLANSSSHLSGGRRRISKDRVSPNPTSPQAMPGGSEFIRKFKPYRSKGFNPESHEQAGSEIQLTEIDKVLQQQDDKRSLVPPLFKLAPRESSEMVEGGTLSSSSSANGSRSPSGIETTGASSSNQANQSGKSVDSRNELTTSATGSAPVTKQQNGGSAPTKQSEETKGSPSTGKVSNDRLAFILIGGSCALSVVCLVLAAMSMRCQDMCDDYRSLRNAERAAMKLQKHRLKYTKSHQINRLSSSGHERGSTSIDDLQDNLSLNHPMTAPEIPVRSATSNKCLAPNLSGSHLNNLAQFGDSSANMNIWGDCQAMNALSSAGNKESKCRCANCSRWSCLDSGGQHEKPQLAAWQQSHAANTHYCLHQTQHPTRTRPLFGAASSVGTFYPRRADDHSAISGGLTEAQMLIDSQPKHSCSLSDRLRGAKQSLHNNNSQKTYQQKQHVCGDFALATCSNPDHGHTHLCHNHQNNNRYNLETSTSDCGKLTFDGSIHHCEAGPKCHHHGASLSKRIKLMQLRSNLHSSHTSTGWRHSDALKSSNYQHQHHHHHHHQHQQQHPRHAKQQQQQPSSSDSSSIDQCTCLHDNQPLLAKNHSRQVDRAGGGHKHLHQHGAGKQEARYSSHKTKRDKAMLVWSTNRDRLI